MSALRDALRTLSDSVFFDLLESDEAYLLVLDVPGASAETLDVAVENGRIEIKARREKSEESGYRYVTENRPLFHDVDLPLPADAIEHDAKATIERGVLELRLPKRTTTTETRIDVVDGDEGSLDGESTPSEDALDEDEHTASEDERR